jgi:hypothetical protein
VAIFTLSGWLFSPSLLLLWVRFRYFVWLGEEPTHTAPELEALLLLLLPLLLILQKDDDDPAQARTSPSHAQTAARAGDTIRK